jgi:hypothetical protein
LAFEGQHLREEPEDKVGRVKPTFELPGDTPDMRADQARVNVALGEHLNDRGMFGGADATFRWVGPNEWELVSVNDYGGDLSATNHPGQTLIGSGQAPDAKESILLALRAEGIKVR